MYRPDNIEDTGYRLAFIELDNRGELWSVKQVSAAVKEIQKAPDGSIVVLFIHGWQNNASEKQGEGKDKNQKNLAGFKDFLAKLAKQKAFQPTEPERQRVIGVFVGWRGKSAYGPFQYATFWGRQRAARRIADSPAATEILLKVVKAAKSRAMPSKVILISHSFGGMILERALAHVIVSSVLRQEEMNQPQGVPVPVDLAVLINPASASIYAKQFVEILSRERVRIYKDGDEQPRPLLVSITAYWDWGTRIAYPVGSFFGVLTTEFRKYRAEEGRCPTTTSQRAFYLNTPGHRPTMHSHIVTADRLPKPDIQNVKPKRQRSDEAAMPDLESGREDVFSFEGKKHRFTMKKKPRALNDTPYWIMRVPRSLISGHSDIFTPNTNRLINALLKYTGVQDTDSKTMMARESGLRPIALIVRPSSGDLIFADRLRRIYRVPKPDPSESGPLKSVPLEYSFRRCIPRAIDPDAAIGLFNDKDSLVVISNYARRNTNYRTEKVSFRIKDRMRQETAHRFARSEGFEAATSDPDSHGSYLATKKRFVAATSDPDSREVYLATKKGEIYIAKGRKLKRLEIEPATANEAIKFGPKGRIRLDAKGQRLFVLGDKSEGGWLYLVDLAPGRLLSRLVPEQFGDPRDIRVDPETGKVYIADAEGGQIWRLTCDSTSCARKVFAKSDKFKQLSLLAIGHDGIVWVALAAQRIFGIGPDGNVRYTISEPTE